MRWTYCYICKLQDETQREDKSVVHIYECHCCWKDYCDKHGSVNTRICDNCLEEAYEMNQTIKSVEGEDESNYTV